MSGPFGDLQPFDLQRMFIGDVPWWFTLEVVVRTCLMYLYALALIRFMSKRAVGQMSLIEFLLVIALGSAVGDPMFYADVPILHGMVVITVVVLLNRGMLFLVNRSELTETALEGAPVLLVRDGRMSPKGLKGALMNREKLFEKLRAQTVTQLGEVERAYLEQGGEFAVFRREQPCTGLRITPPWDLEPPVIWQTGERAPFDERLLGCALCGHVARFERRTRLPRCPDCDSGQWVDAVVEPSA
jgi:uncharacterized membrane protein YcaP (DUF421 family)